jgi:hypothetical protein
VAATVRGRSYYGGPEYVCAVMLYIGVLMTEDSVYNGCCCAGKVSLPTFPDWPFPLRDLLQFDGDDASPEFLRLLGIVIPCSALPLLVLMLMKV